MRTTKSIYRWVTLLLLVSALGIGVSYSAWNDTLFAQLKMTSGNFDTDYANGDVEAMLLGSDFTNADGPATPISTPRILSKAEQSLSIALEDELLRKMVTEGKTLMLRAPIQTKEDSDIKRVNEKQADRYKPDLELTLAAEQAEFVSNNRAVSMPRIEGQYDLDFKIYQEVTATDEQSSAILYIRAEGNAPGEELAVLEASEIPELAVLAVDGRLQGALRLTYHLELPILLEQFNASGE